MTKAAPKDKAPKGAGRRCLYDTRPMKPKTIRMTESQRNKVDRPGGHQWVRDLIDAAE